MGEAAAEAPAEWELQHDYGESSSLVAVSSPAKGEPAPEPGTWMEWTPMRKWRAFKLEWGRWRLT